MSIGNLKNFRWVSEQKGATVSMCGICFVSKCNNTLCFRLVKRWESNQFVEIEQCCIS